MRYFHSSNNLSGRYLEEPHLITNVQDYEDILKSIEQTDVLQYALNTLLLIPFKRRVPASLPRIG